MLETPLLPAEYYDRADRPSLLVGTGVVLVEALLITIVTWIFVQQIVAQIDLSPAQRAEMGGAIGGAVVGVFIGVVFGWLLFAALMHVFVWFAGGDRGFGTTLAVLGEAELVTIVLLPLAVIGLFTMVESVPSNPAYAASFLESAGLYVSPIGLITSFVGFVWRAFIQGIGLAEAHDIPVEKMLVLAFVLGFLGFLLNLL